MEVEIGHKFEKVKGFESTEGCLERDLAAKAKIKAFLTDKEQGN